MKMYPVVQNISIYDLYLKPAKSLESFCPPVKKLALVAMVTLSYLPYSTLHAFLTIVTLTKDFM
jgi:hypothetical protein